MSTTNGTTARYIAANDGYLVPATADTSTDLNLLPICEAVYHRMNGGKVSRATLALVMRAMADSFAVVTLYIGADGKQDARVLWPNSITLTKDNNITCKAYCTMRREVRSFRIDRMLTIHALTTPDDADFTPDPAATAPYYSTQEGVFAHLQAQEVARAAAQGRMPRAMND